MCGLLWLWLARSHPGASPLAWVVLAVAACFVAADTVATSRRRNLVERAPYVSVLVGGALIVAWVGATGGGHSPFLPMLFLGTATAPARLGLSMTRGVAVSAGYAAAYLGFAGFPAGIWASSVLLMIGLLLALRNRLLHSDRRLSVRDALTGCFVRWYAEFLLEEWLRRGRLPLSVALIDLDGFNVVNDRYGHTAGDRVLLECARILTSNLRPDDILARYGGDEFVALLPGLGREEAQALAARLGPALQRAPVALPEGGTPVSVAASVGVAEASPGQAPAALVAAADQNLYRAKAARPNPGRAAEQRAPRPA